MLKEKVCATIDELSERLIAVSTEIHSNPELNFKEFKASKLLAEKLTEENFKVELGVANLDTAIRAEHPEQKNGPTIAILAEYDALPEVGHGCGHNLIATAALGAALGLGRIKKELAGKLLFLGTPAEEGGGGKVLMLNAGLFKNVDAAMMFHPSGIYTDTGVKGLAMTEVKIEFFGQTAHAASDPENGINALDAVIQTFNGINALRQHITSDARIHGIITDGGIKPNIVPDYAAASFYIRALNNDYCETLIKKVENCAKGAAFSTGADMKFERIEPSYQSRNMNKTMGKAFLENLKLINEPLRPIPKGMNFGSSDIGNISQIVPTIHPYVAISEKPIPGHSKEFAKAAISEKGQNAMLAAAKGLAMTAIDLFTNPEMMREVQEEFKNSIAEKE
ncbi:MAG TPA: M20 family metallopeptidase [Candidatus Bathyarchaeia archaeon]|nr:M20 family metallopeptidase [Candidatus Bathyarchaeia archaeon]